MNRLVIWQLPVIRLSDHVNVLIVTSLHSFSFVFLVRLLNQMFYQTFELERINLNLLPSFGMENILLRPYYLCDYSYADKFFRKHASVCLRQILYPSLIMQKPYLCNFHAGK